MTFLSRIMLLKSQAHFSTDVQRGGTSINGAAFKGTGKRKTELARKRVGLMIAGFTVAYAVIGGRLVLRELFSRIARLEMPEVFTATALMVV